MKNCLLIGPKSVTWYKDGYPLLKNKELFIGHKGHLEDEGMWLTNNEGEEVDTNQDLQPR